MKKIISNNKFLFIYGLIIIVILIVMFAMDDKFFVNKEKEIAKIKKVMNTSPSYDEQLQALLNNKYNYHYTLNYNGVTYTCQGVKNQDEEKGSCSEPKNIEYTNDNYQEIFKDINTDYLDVNYIYKAIKDIDPEEMKLDVKTYYTYNVNILNIKGKIEVYSDSERITQITIVNGFLTYVLYFDSIN